MYLSQFPEVRLAINRVSRRILLVSRFGGFVNMLHINETTVPSPDEH
jgi:hypothetical protein